MFARFPVLMMICICSPSIALAQATPGENGAGDMVNAREADGRPYRYPMPAVADTVRDLQHVSQAMVLREYCADKRIPDAFVNEQLMRFGRITGRKEDCRTLLEY